MRKAGRFWILVASWAVLIFVLSSIPGRKLPSVDVPQSDKIAHAVVYAVMGGLAFVAVRRTWKLKRATLVAIAAGIAAAYGLTDEFHQLFVPERSADIYDAVADGLGGLAGATLVSLVGRIRTGRDS
jgi:VanZ family protein